jgi:hypothetical protein
VKEGEGRKMKEGKKEERKNEKKNGREEGRKEGRKACFWAKVMLFRMEGGKGGRL